MFSDIEASKNWEITEPVDKGWSSDRKYRIKTKDGKTLLLRISDIGQYDAKEREYRVIEKYSKLGFPMSMPIEFGVCNEGKNVYMLLSWVEGCDLETLLPKLSEEEQYLMGRQAGDILRKIHSVRPEPEEMPVQTKQAKKLYQLSRYEDSDLRIPDDEVAIRYVKDNIDKIWRKPPVYLHGDFHPGNLIYMKDGSIGVIDFNRWEIGDPYEEFYKLESFGTEISIPYCIGQVDAYFGDEIPEEFWSANAVYVAQASLFSIKWAEPFGQKDIDGMVRRAEAAFMDYDGFREIVPKWYTAEYRTRYGNKGLPDGRKP